MTTPLIQPEAPPVARIRHELKRRDLTVECVERLTPAMLRLTLSGPDLADFPSLAPDDHVKLFVPDGSGGIARRDYTPRRFDRASGRLVIDFALHEAGPATAWALGARVGDPVAIGGPKGSAVIGPEVRDWLLVGDETALPAMGRRIEEARAGTRITSIAAIPGPADAQAFETAASLTALWAHRPPAAANDPRPLLAILKTIALRPGTFVWIAAEATVARAVRAHVLTERGHPIGWIKAAGYWVMGEADAHEKFA